jgi:phage-related protein
MALASRNASVPADGRRPLRNPHRFADERTARVLLCLCHEHLVAVHGFIKKTRATPDEDLELARKRQRELLR